MDLDVGSIITASGAAVAVVLKAVTTWRRHRFRDLEQRVAELEEQLLGWAEWAHTARIRAAAGGVRLPAIPTPRSSTDSAEKETA